MLFLTNLVSVKVGTEANPARKQRVYLSAILNGFNDKGIGDLVDKNHVKVVFD